MTLALFFFSSSIIHSAHYIQCYISSIILKFLLSRQNPSITHYHTPNHSVYAQVFIHSQTKSQLHQSYWITDRDPQTLWTFKHPGVPHPHRLFTSSRVFFFLGETSTSLLGSAVTSSGRLAFSHTELLRLPMYSCQFVRLYIKPQITLSPLSLLLCLFLCTFFNNRAYFTHSYHHRRWHCP